MMKARWPQLGLITAVLLGIAAWYFLLGDKQPGTAASPPTAPVPGPPLSTGPNLADPAPKVETATLTGESRLADDLNSPAGTIQRDLDILKEVFEMWQSNFPRTGNPIGENVEMTSALTGANEHRYAFIPPGHRAINARGELCDRWGTPFRFHQLSGQHMEIRSAGPDRKYLTDDDVVLSPDVAVIR